MQTPNALVENVDPSTLAADPAALSRLAITRFLARTRFSAEKPAVTPDETVGEQARNLTNEWDLGGFSPRIFNAALETSIGYATIIHAHAPPSTQLYIALYSVLVIAIDDGLGTPEVLRAFADRMHQGLPQLHPLLDRLVEVLNDTANHYSTIGAREIIKATLDFVDVSILELDAAKIPLRPKALSYILAKRRASGLGRAYGNFVWDKAHFPNYYTYMQAVPDMEIFMDQANDILSFYKEELAGEKGNFVNERGLVTNRGAAGALLDTVDDAVTSVQNVRSILEGTGELAIGEAAMERYVAWHCLDKRYKLSDILGEN